MVGKCAQPTERGITCQHYTEIIMYHSSMSVTRRGQQPILSPVRSHYAYPAAQIIA